MKSVSSKSVELSRVNKTLKAKTPVWTWRDAIAATDVPPLTKLVCYDISRHISDAGKSWRIPVKSIIGDTGLSNRAVAAHLKNAVAAGLLVMRREVNARGHRSITTYAPRFPDHVTLARQAELPQVTEGHLGLSDGGSRQVPFHKLNLSNKRATEKKKGSSGRAKLRLAAVGGVAA